MSVQVFAYFLIGLFVFLEWSHVSSLYILEIKPLSEVSLANVFSYDWFPFHFNVVFFSHAEASLFELLIAMDFEAFLTLFYFIYKLQL